MTLIHKVPYKIIGNTIHFNVEFNNPLDEFLLTTLIYPNALFMDKWGFNCKNPIMLIKILRKSNLLGIGIELKNLILSQDLVFLSLSIKINTCLPISKKLKYFCSENDLLDLTKNMNFVVLNDNFNKHLFLTKNLRKVVFGEQFNKLIILPKKMIFLSFKKFYNHPLVLSPNIEYLKLGDGFKQNIIFEKTIKTIIINMDIIKPYHYRLLENLPNGLNKTKTTVECFLKKIVVVFSLKDNTCSDHRVIMDKFITNSKSNIPTTADIKYLKCDSDKQD